MNDRVRITVDGHVADVMLDRADKMNAADIQMFEEIIGAADRIANDRAVRAVVLHGAGSSFCAGIDLAIFGDKDFEFQPVLKAPLEPSPANLFQRAAYAWRELGVPVIAALRGVVFGAGFQIALGCDIRYAAADARFSVLESKWGIVPDMGITATARHILSPDRAKELAWTAREFDAEEAARLGLLTEVVDDPHRAAHTLASECASRSPDAIRSIKKLVNVGWDATEADALALEAEQQAQVIGGRNQIEAVRANLEKRAPNFED